MEYTSLKFLCSVKDSFLSPFRRCAPSILENACSRYSQNEVCQHELLTLPHSLLTGLEIESENTSPLRTNFDIPTEEFYATRTQAIANADHERNVFPTRALKALEFALRTPILDEEAHDKSLSNANILFDMGVIMTEIGKPEKSIECWTKALAYEPENTQFLYCLGALKLRQNKAAKAKDLLYRSLEELEKDESANSSDKNESTLPLKNSIRFALANAERSLGNLEEAEKHFVALLKEDTEVKAEVLALLADVCQKKGETGKAISLLAQALEIRPHDHSFKKQLESLKMD
eukprot:GHVP01025606.1.p2 GENE.GHVP01025606.1~~GHVP01025606.1.p2  ORF type:complete len:290 (+),score=64.13 GHVP01025606.1:741-1610(+)